MKLLSKNNKQIQSNIQLTTTPATRYHFYALLLLLILSVSAYVVNLYGDHFPGNNYFPPHTIYIALSLILIYYGFKLQFGVTSRPTVYVKEVILFFIVMCAVAFATNAVQYTPFLPIDHQVLAVDTFLHVNTSAMMSWTYEHALFRKILACIYDTLPYQMVYLPLIVIATKRIQYLREYYFLLLISVMIGFAMYYFFPTTAPASIMASEYFSTTQLATGLKFKQIHHYIQPTTLDGGMIALPSFHAIWAWLCLYLLRGWPVGLIILAPINILLIASCVLLGWHYLTDILAALVVVLTSHGLLRVARKSEAIHTVH